MKLIALALGMTTLGGGLLCVAAPSDPKAEPTAVPVIAPAPAADAPNAEKTAAEEHGDAPAEANDKPEAPATGADGKKSAEAAGAASPGVAPVAAPTPEPPAHDGKASETKPVEPKTPEIKASAVEAPKEPAKSEKPAADTQPEAMAKPENKEAKSGEATTTSPVPAQSSAPDAMFGAPSGNVMVGVLAFLAVLAVVGVTLLKLKGNKVMALTVGKRNALGFATVLVITAALSGFAFARIESLQKDTSVITRDCMPGLYHSGQMESCVRTNNGRLYKHIVADQPAEMDSVEAEIKVTSTKQSEHMEAYEKSITRDDDRKLFETLAAVRASYTNERKEALALSRAGKKAEAEQYIVSKVDPAFDVYIKAIEAIADFNKTASTEMGAQISGNVASSERTIIGGVAAAMLIGSLLAFFITRGVNRALGRMASTLGEGADQVASASGQVAASSQSLAQGASEQAASLEETTSALEETASMTRKNAETAQQAAALTGETKSAADRGNQAMQRMGTAIADIQKSAGETAKIIKVIDEIAFQTNLLALNAAVEAARAGEAGKGFAVVAEEVRNLAMRSSEAAKTTSTMIEESVQNSRNGVAISSEVAKTLEEINTSVAKVDALVAEIAAASKEQAQGIDQINSAVAEMDKVTQSNAASAEESASAAEELSSQAVQLTSVVNELSALVGAAQREAKKRPAAVNKAASGARPAPVKVVGPAKNGTKVKPAAHAIPFDDEAHESDFSEFKNAA